MGEFRGTGNKDDAKCGKDCSTDSYMDNSSNTNDDDYAECSLGDHNKSQPNDPSSSHNVFHSVEEDNVALDEYWNIVQMNFQTEDECYNFYNSYAKRKGFSEGIRDPSLVKPEDRARRERALTRMECAASLSIKLDKKRGIWFVDNFIDDHNHPLTSHDETPFLRSHRKIKDFQKSEIHSLESIGIRKNVIMKVMKCKYGGYDKVGFVKKDLYNYSSRYKRSRILEGDASATLELMKKRRDKDPGFFYEYQVDDEGRLKNLFWCDAQSRMDYQSFGDVVFDSTQRMNKYNMPFIPFVGLNHHRQTTIFACGIVSDECVESYTWFLQVFLRAMCQQKPRSIITDSDNAMMKAIRQVLPDTDHRVCSWHIERGINKHLHFSQIKIFRSFIYDACSHAEFEEKWSSFVLKYRTSRNKGWLKRMYRKRKLWAAAFLTNTYFLGMKSNQRSESLNSCLHRHLDYYMSLLDLVEHYEVCVSELREKEAEFDSKASQSWPATITDSPEIEESAGHIFTSANFDLVQKELQKLDGLHVDVVQDGKGERYMVTSEQKSARKCYVDYTRIGGNHDIRCSCRKMEREGIPCKHILSVLKHLEVKVKEIPKCCVLQRLSKNAKADLPSVRKSDLHVWTEKQKNYYELNARGSELFDLASNSCELFGEVKEYMESQLSKISSSNAATKKHTHVDEVGETSHRPEGSVLDPICVATKGAPRSMKGWDEHRPRLCSRCRQPGHDIRRCPEAKREE
ncbi:protein FAR1-RELATED SEQUENCE 5-like [Oryza sativa Japonica Group]|uniref:protein FAR1-RELATED SEQUENCE 5-like n=1 Tax=Oryza sativa subsp. japonica TaxID=39947 RepID=UPI00339CE692